MRAFHSALLGLLLVAPAGAQPLAATGFETVADGPFTECTTSAGVLRAAEGHARIDSEHRKSGVRCLHILGGENHAVELTTTTGDAEVGELTFWAERWTRRDPFRFRVETFENGAWREIYDGDSAVVIGTFKTEVRVPMATTVERLRFSCTSVSGVLIDDLRLTKAAPMEVAEVSTRRPDVPCIVGRSDNPGAVIRFETTGCLYPLEVSEVRLRFYESTRLENIESVAIVGPDGAQLGEPQAPAARMEFAGRLPLRSGTNDLVVQVAIKADADLDGFVDVGCIGARLTNGDSFQPNIVDPIGAQRLAIALRDGGDDGVAAYRIPGLETTPKGTLIAVYDARWKGWGDLPGDIDVGMSRSTDGGRTWEPMKIIMDMGRDPEHRFDGIGDPSILCDQETGTIWVAATWSHGNRAWRGSGPGLTPDETGQLMLARSDDDGVTWSEPINITSAVKQPEWCYLLQGPGRGIQMKDGTLVFTAQYQDAKRMPHSTILYSKDHGTTWQLGKGFRPNTTESTVVELEAGVLMLNMRDNRGGSRAIYTTTDLGQTWQEHPTSRKALPEPVCNASLIRANDKVLVFCNPAVDKAPRRNMTLKGSRDLGKTWPSWATVLLDEGQSAGYPCLTMIDENTLGVLFEGSRAQLTFVRVPLFEVIR